MTQEEREYCQIRCKGFRDTGGRYFVDGRCAAFIQYFQKREQEMTNEEKQLLLIDLCVRLPYGVYCLENLI